MGHPWHSAYESCGGGFNLAEVGSGGTGTYARGPIEGFGLISDVPRSGVFQAHAIEQPDTPPNETSEARIAGSVTQWGSVTEFQIMGIPVDATAAFAAGAISGSASLKQGALVQARGLMKDGFLMANVLIVGTAEKIRANGLRLWVQCKA